MTPAPAQTGPHASVVGCTVNGNLTVLAGVTCSALDLANVNDDRSRYLSTAFRASIARCTQRWQALGVSRDRAAQLANDPRVGQPDQRYLPDSEHPVRVLIAEMGTGKSLIGERIHQSAIQRAVSDPDSAMPVYLSAKECVNGIGKSLGELLPSSLRRCTVYYVLVDGAEEPGIAEAEGLLAGARVFVGTFPGSTVTITSRPISAFARIEERVTVEPLPAQGALELLSSFAEREVGIMATYGWPKSVLSAINRPLFAILLGLFLRDQGNAAASNADLLTHLVDRAVGVGNEAARSSRSVLRRLAVRIIDNRHESVSSADVATPEVLYTLSNSNLVVVTAQRINFALPILAEWFAAEALSVGEVQIEAVAQDRSRLGKWRYPVAIAIGTSPDDALAQIARTLVRSDPGFAAEIIDEVTTGWSGFRAREEPLPGALQCAEMLHGAMTAWTAGIGELSRFIAPMKRDGTLCRLEAARTDTQLVMRWRDSSGPSASASPDGVVVPWASQPSDARSVSLVTPARERAWPWRTTQEMLASQLKKMIEDRKFPITDGPLLDELCWRLALDCARMGSLTSQPVPIQGLANQVERPIAEEFIQTPHGVVSLAALRAKVQPMLAGGVIQPPWPGPDQAPRTNYIWGGYSDQAVIARVNSVYGHAIAAYRMIVDQYFTALSPRLQTRMLLPACFIARLARVGGYGDCPSMTCWFQPIPGNADRIDVSFGVVDSDTDIVGPQWEAIRQLRPAQAECLFPSFSSTILADIFRADPVSKIVYGWLDRDLKAISWV